MNEARELLQLPEGSGAWRNIFLIAAALIVLWQMASGWRAGLARAIAGLLSLGGAYTAAWFLGPPLTPHLRGALSLPDFLVSAAGGAGAGLIVYGLAVMISHTLFKSTRDQRNPFVRFVYGASGSVVGLVVGVLIVWGLLIGIRLLGTVAETAIIAQTTEESSIGATGSGTVRSVRASPAGRAPARKEIVEASAETGGIAHTLAKMKASIELGPGEALVAMVDPVPENVYAILKKLTRLSQSPAGAERFLRYPGARELANDPRILALLDDVTIRKMIERRDFLGLIRNEKIVAVANDPELKERLGSFPLDDALDYGLSTGPGPEMPADAPRARLERLQAPAILGLRQAAVFAS